MFPNTSADASAVASADNSAAQFFPANMTWIDNFSSLMINNRIFMGLNEVWTQRSGCIYKKDYYYVYATMYPGSNEVWTRKGSCI